MNSHNSTLLTARETLRREFKNEEGTKKLRENIKIVEEGIKN